MDEILARPEACWGQVVQAFPGDKREGGPLGKSWSPLRTPLKSSLLRAASVGTRHSWASRGTRLTSVCSSLSPTPPSPVPCGCLSLSFSTLLSSTLFSSNDTGPCPRPQKPWR